MMTLVAAIRSLATYIGIALYIPVRPRPGCCWRLLFGWSDVLYMLGHGGCPAGSAAVGHPVLGHRPRARPPRRAVVFCANHQSNVDPPILFTSPPAAHILFKAELLKLPLLGRVFLAGGFVPVVRENREQAMASIAAGGESLRAGNSFLIFPEGTRSRASEMLPFKKGGFIMALTAQARSSRWRSRGPGGDAEGQPPCLAGEGANRRGRADRDAGPDAARSAIS